MHMLPESEIKLKNEIERQNAKINTLEKLLSASTPAISQLYTECERLKQVVLECREEIKEKSEQIKYLEDENNKITDAKLISVFVKTIDNNRRAISKTYGLTTEDKKVIKEVRDILSRLEESE